MNASLPALWISTTWWLQPSWNVCRMIIGCGSTTQPGIKQQLYDTFRRGYYSDNVAPGGVGDSYKELGQFFDREYARLACPALHGQALREMAGADG